MIMRHAAPFIRCGLAFFIALGIVTGLRADSPSVETNRQLVAAADDQGGVWGTSNDQAGAIGNSTDESVVWGT
jgi:hypothetical protein